MTQPLFLIGARGAGKTTVGSALALALGYQFIDTDLFMQHAAQMSVAKMVEREGWLGFRRRENIALHTVSQPSTIIATGGGMILAQENRWFMRQHGTVIYLHAPASVLAQWLEAYPQDAQRPTLTGKPIAEEMFEVLAAREALYREAAHYVMEGTADPQQVIEQICAVLQYERVK
ncbi:MAG: shikimate kinase AroL [Serratia symbiotica]|nr:shikimate kinase AroL [Serratia symbiotica]